MAAALLAMPALGVGPDVIVGDLHQQHNYGTALSGGVTIRAYSIGTTSCNIGDQNLDWFAGTNQHPVIGQTIYRLMTVDGSTRMEQLGQSWLKHGFCALQQTVCGGCSPVCGGCCSQLGVGCSDPYSWDLNGDQTNLGPKSEVNASTGFFPYCPDLGWTNCTGNTGNVIYKRIQVRQTDIDPANNPGALYFIEGQYVHPDDALVNGVNNASYRRVTVNATTFNLVLQGTTQRQKPAIMAWRDHGLGANMPDNAVDLVPVDVAGDGRFWVGARATDLGNGMWHYEYLVQNINSDRSMGGFSVPIGGGVTVTNVGFHDVDYHSGEIYDNAGWGSSVTSSAVSWDSPQTFAQNKFTNALRWGTAYNYRFDANVPPTTGDVTLTLFKPGSPASVTAFTVVPNVPECACSGDLNGSNTVDGGDAQPFVAMMLGAEPVDPCADMAAPSGGPLDSADLDAFVNELLNGGVCE